MQYSYFGSAIKMVSETKINVLKTEFKNSMHANCPGPMFQNSFSLKYVIYIYIQNNTREKITAK